MKVGQGRVDGNESAAQREVQRLLDELANAHLQSDGAALDRIRSEDYVFTTLDGRLLDKAQARVAPGDFTLSRYDHDDVRVRVYGDAAIATGRITIAGSFRGSPRNGQSRFTRVFVKRDGRWQLVANQVTRITPPRTDF
jgi:ketosteroid isomerase-like protein